jgi:hypothetical protein
VATGKGGNLGIGDTGKVDHHAFAGRARPADVDRRDATRIA